MWQHMLHIPPIKILISLSLKRTTQKPHTKAYLSGNGCLGKKKSGELSKSRATRIGRRTKGDIEKWEQTDSPEIPDRGRETSEIAGLPPGVTR